IAIVPFLVFVAACAIVSEATAQHRGPTLEINSPFAGTVQSLDGDSSGNYLVTGSSARTLTIWTKTADDVWQPAINHAPYRDEFASSPYLAAITPDARHVAFAVPPLSNGKGSFEVGTAQIYILDRVDQHLITVLSKAIPTRITKIRFSADGKY